MLTVKQAQEEKMPYKLVECLRCGHVWPTKSERPTTCPNIHCHSDYWDKPRKIKREGTR